MPPDPNDRFIEINGHELRYRVRGEDGHPLAVIGHGLLGSIEQLGDHEAAFEALSARLRILLFDARGHGASEGPEEAAGYTWETLGLDMAAIAAHEGEVRPVLGGASMSAAAALWAGIERPELPRALILMAPPPLGPPTLRGADERQALQVLELLAGAVESMGLEQTVATARGFPGFAATPEEAETRAAWLLSQNPRTIAPIIRGLFTAPFHQPEEYGRVRVPTIVFAHEGDGLHPLRSAQLLAEHVPDCRLHVGPAQNYWQAHTDEFVREVNAFLDAIA